MSCTTPGKALEATVVKCMYHKILWETLTFFFTVVPLVVLVHCSIVEKAEGSPQQLNCGFLWQHECCCLFTLGIFSFFLKCSLHLPAPLSGSWCGTLCGCFWEAPGLSRCPMSDLVLFCSCVSCLELFYGREGSTELQEWDKGMH